MEKGAAPNDLYATVMGREKGGRIRMVGLGPSPENYWGKNNNRAEIMRKAAESTEEVRALKQEVQAYRQEKEELQEKCIDVQRKYTDMEHKYSQVQTQLSSLVQVVEELRNQAPVEHRVDNLCVPPSRNIQVVLQKLTCNFLYNIKLI